MNVEVGSGPAKGLDPVSPEDLRRRLGDVLEIAERSVPVLAVDLPEALGDRQAFRKEKFICETALLVYASGPFAMIDPALRQTWRRLAERLVAFAEPAVVGGFGSGALRERDPSLLDELFTIGRKV